MFISRFAAPIWHCRGICKQTSLSVTLYTAKSFASMVIRPASESVAKTGAASMRQRRDPNTLANYDQWTTTHTTTDFTIDFDAKRLKGTVHLTLENLAKDSRQIILDTRYDQRPEGAVYH